MSKGIMIKFLYELRLKFLIFFERTSHSFFETTIGQKILILLAPFFLLPGERSESQAFLKLFRFLHMQFWAPMLGGFFFSGALTVFLRTLQRAHFPFIGYIDVEAFNILILLTSLNVFLGYIFAITHFLTPYCLNLCLKEEKLITEPFLFWTTRYGGFLMFFGLIAWLGVGLIALNPSWFIFLLLLGIISALGYAIRKELKQQRQKFILRIPLELRRDFYIVQGMILGILLLLMVGSFYWIFAGGK